MNEQRWSRITELFEATVACNDSSSRERELHRLCPDDIGIRAEVLELLEAHDANADYLEQPAQIEAGFLIADQIHNRWIGRSLGPWTIEGLISEGGMGAVFTVRRNTGGFRQTAALKVIRAGFESSHLVERFERERQLLARLEHRNIARLLDGGTSEEGLPWLVMDLIDGKPIDRWCDERRLSINARLALFQQVADAVHFAHQNLVVHRDLKAENILVTSDGQVKLLDFGIAKLISDSSGKNDQTLTQQRVLTPSASSPEQFMGQPITTASDVYALGLLLYRLLSGHPPYLIDVTTAVNVVHQKICHETPLRPSEAVSQSDRSEAIARQRSTRFDRLQRHLSGDLDTIVMKALRKEPERRYSSVQALAEDIERYRQGLPVTARPDSVSYRSHKFVGRHWKGLLATAAAFAALAIGLSMALWQADQARAERDRTLQINEFLQTILIEADPYEAGADATVRDVLRKASELVGERFAGQPDLEAPLRQTIGYTQLGLMELDDSQANLVRADRLNQSLYDPDDERNLQTRANLAWIEYRRGRLDAADEAYRLIIDQLGPAHSPAFKATVLNDYGVVLSDMENYGEAAARHRQSLDLWLTHAPEREEVATAYNNIAYALHGQGDLEQAETLYRKSLSMRRATSPDGLDPDLANNINNLAILLRDMNRLDEALPLYYESLRIRQATLGVEHAFTGLGHLNLGRMLLDLDQFEEARSELEVAVRISEAKLEPEQLQVLVARASHARSLALSGENEIARETLDEVVALMQKNNAPNNFLEQAQAWLGELSP